ncbi:UMP kinase [Methanomassiliicoccus luminyensis]|mgnify:CR=1 FL=1|jgi:uridylate kinase|uniref:UMP kinase n=1 Tax=Methanomassiliicoccus luminyensis TaxID=1080712 RepID=UPI000369E1FA|nr:UMP kinase [Methanomassiliicoccus luminyensis]
MEKVVVSLGGSIIIPDDRDGEFLSKFASVLSKVSEEFEVYVVCGGGKIARYYIVTGRELQATEDELDDLGIQATRINARLVQLALKSRAIQTVPTTVEEAAALGGKGKVVIMGGTTPGHTTDGVSAALAEKVGASRVVNATSVDGVYTADPRKDKSARKYDRISFQQLREMLGGKHGAGSSHVFDPMGAEIVMRNKIPILVVAGRDLAEMERAIRGQRISGTVIDG